MSLKRIFEEHPVMTPGTRTCDLVTTSSISESRELFGRHGRIFLFQLYFHGNIVEITSSYVIHKRFLRSCPQKALASKIRQGRAGGPGKTSCPTLCDRKDIIAASVSPSNQKSAYFCTSPSHRFVRNLTHGRLRRFKRTERKDAHREF